MADITVDPSVPHPVALWSGAYTQPRGGSRGISRIDHDSAETATVVTAAETDSPSFLALHPTLPLLYAVGEATGTLQAFRIRAGDLLEPVGTAWPAGNAVCHVALDPAGRFAVVTCWGSGEVIAYELDSDGLIVARHVAQPAVDPYDSSVGFGEDAERPRQSRAHATAFLPDGRLVTTDLGFDLLRVWHLEPGAGLVLDDELALGLGCGPRHLAVHQSGRIFLVTEYSIEVLVIGSDDAGRLTVRQRVSARTADSTGDAAAAEISIDPAGERVYVSVRGTNRIATLAVRDGGASLELLGDTDCGGLWPRHHVQAGSTLYVANQVSNLVSAFRIDAKTGMPGELITAIPVDAPTCLVERRR